MSVVVLVCVLLLYVIMWSFASFTRLAVKIVSEITCNVSIEMLNTAGIGWTDVYQCCDWSVWCVYQCGVGRTGVHWDVKYYSNQRETTTEIQWHIGVIYFCYVIPVCQWSASVNYAGFTVVDNAEKLLTFKILSEILILFGGNQFGQLRYVEFGAVLHWLCRILRQSVFVIDDAAWTSFCVVTCLTAIFNVLLVFGDHCPGKLRELQREFGYYNGNLVSVVEKLLCPETPVKWPNLYVVSPTTETQMWNCTQYSAHILFGPNSRPNSVFIFGQIVSLCIKIHRTNNSRHAAAAHLPLHEASKANSPVSQTF